MQAAKDAVRNLIGWRRYRSLVLTFQVPRDLARVEHWRRSPEGRESCRCLAELRNVHAGRRAFVVGNGPSLNQMDLRPLAREIAIGSNGLFLAFDRMGFKPTYYTIEDPLVAGDRAKEAAAIVGCRKIYPHDLAPVLGSAGDPVFVPFRRRYFGFPKFGGDLSEAAYWGGTVTVFNLQLAYHLGCDPVYLIGCDHAYTVKSDVKKDGTRFTSTSDDPNHFDPSYFGKGYRWHDPNVERMEEGYLACRAAFEAVGRRIVNATVGGKLEVFPREDFVSLFGRGGD